MWFNRLDSTQKIDFIQKAVNISDSKGNTFPLVLADFQAEWLKKGPLFSDFRLLTKFQNRIALKCRNVGASYIMVSLEAVLTAWLYDKVTIPFIASTEDQTKTLITSCINLITELAFDVGLKGGIKNQSKSEITFLNGSRIKSFSSNPSGMRGTRAMNVYLDEFAHVTDDQGVYDAVNYFIQEGGQLSVMSTPYGKQNLYWRIWSDRLGYPPENWYRIDIKPFKGDFDINKSLKKQHSEGRIELLIPWLNLDKTDADRMADAHNGYANFMQEMLGIPLEEVTSVISTALLDTVTRDEFFVDSRIDDDQRTFVMGVDYAATNNMTAAVTALFEKDRLVVCGTKQFSGNVDVQIDEIVSYTNLYSPSYYYGDATGLGGKSFQDILGAKANNIGMIVGVDYTKKDIAQRYGSNMNNKEFMINRCLELFARGKIIVPNCFRELRLQILGVRKYVYENHVKYSGKDSLTKNDDLAMAFFQLVLSYDMHFGMSDLERVDSGNVDWFNRDSKPKTKKAQYFEGGSVNNKLVDGNVRRGGFSQFG